MKILVRREAARGDVLVASAVVPALKKKYDGCKIAFYTKCPSVLTKNIYIDFVTDSSDILEEEFDLRIDLDMAYENRPTTHVLQAYADVAQVPIEDCKLYIHCERVNMPLFNNYVVIHAGITNWVGRNWSNEGWRSLALQLHDKGYQIVCVGAGGDRFVECDVCMRGEQVCRPEACYARTDNGDTHTAYTSFPLYSVVVIEPTSTPSRQRTLTAT